MVLADFRTQPLLRWLASVRDAHAGEIAALPPTQRDAATHKVLLAEVRAAIAYLNEQELIVGDDMRLLETLQWLEKELLGIVQRRAA